MPHPIRTWLGTAEKLFTRHPAETSETYGEHLWFTLRLSFRFAYICLIILIHGIFPFLLTRTASNEVQRIYDVIKARVPGKGMAAQKVDAPCVAIVGGGFSGAIVMANLVRQAAGPLSIEWFDSNGLSGTGLAYGTTDAAHLLNIRAENMGAFAEHPDGFFRWLQSVEGKSAAQALWPNHAITAESFVPRALYAHYLKHIVQESLAKAQTKGIAVHARKAQVVDVELHNAQTQQLMLAMEHGVKILADALVLATGNLPPRSIGVPAGTANYVADIWHARAEDIFPHRVSALPADANIIIIGTGLTMVDAVLTLKSHDYKGIITAISRHGRLPASHAASKPYPAWNWVTHPETAPRTAPGLLQGLRNEIAKAEAEGYDWRNVVDSLRPVTQRLWNQLDVASRRRFLQRLFTLWNIHRHRMAPEIHAELSAMQERGALNIIAGKITSIDSTADGLSAVYRRRGADRAETIRPALVLNCTGPEYNVALSKHKLLEKLTVRGLITPTELHAGIALTPQLTAAGKAPDAVFPLGALLLGELLECTAVTELRQQAHQLASAVLARLEAPDAETKVVPIGRKAVA